jgi:prolyl 4-hydroxylase
MTQLPMFTRNLADRAALARVGRSVRDRLLSDPRVYALDHPQAEIFSTADFISPGECAHLIGMIDAVAQPSPIYASDNKEAYRTSYSGDVDPEDSFVRMIERRICDLVGLDQSWGETIQGQRYAPGQEFRGHYDAFDTHADYWPSEARRGGQRSWTAMAWLNEVEEGGNTEFSQLGIAFPPQQGTLLLWNNALPGGAPNPHVIHAGTPVVRGTKYIITKWFRTRPWG